MNALNRILVLTIFGVLISIKGKYIALTQGGILKPITWIRVKIERTQYHRVATHHGN